MITGYDKILVVIIILVAAFGFLFFSSPKGESENRIVIESRGEVVRVFPLDELEPGKQIPIGGPLGNSTLEMGEAKVRMVDSPCPDHICVQMGWISKPGEMIVCMPNQIVVRVEGRREAGTDAIAR